MSAPASLFTPESASVHPHDITVDPAEQATLEQQWAHSATKSEREALLAILPSLNLTWRDQNKIEQCGRGAWLERSPSTRTYRIRADYCKHRLCPTCAARRGRKLGDRIHAAMEATDANRWRFITLTLPATHDTLAQQLDHLRNSFRRLRQTKAWKRHVAGGWAIAEITVNPSSGTWHPHLHVICHGTYFPHDRLKSAWRSATNGATVVDIRTVRNTRNAARYVAKYVGKPPTELYAAKPKTLDDYNQAMTGRRTLIGFGRRAPLPRISDLYDTPLDFQRIMPLWKLLQMAERGDHVAMAILNTLRSKPDEYPTLFHDTT